MADSEIKVAPAETTPIDLNDPKLYINRELSLLEFQRRVLEEAQDKTNPLLERVKFLAILGSNLDEFFMVRVAGLRKQVRARITDYPTDGMSAAENLAIIRKIVLDLLAQARNCLISDILPNLNKSGIHIINYARLTARQKETVNDYYKKVIFPVLTPLAFDPGHPFPHISNRSLNLAVLIKDQNKQEHFARIKVPNSLPRLLPIKRSSGGIRKDGTVPHHHYFVFIEQVIAANLESLFPGMKVIESHPFRVVRDADLVIQELEADDLLETMEVNVRKRRFGSVVRVAINESMPAHIRKILMENLEIGRNEMYAIKGSLGLSDLMQLYNIDRYDLKDPVFKPVVPDVIKVDPIDGGIFNAVENQDILLHHPYDSFIPVIDFMKQAAHDPDVLAIKQTLYRVGRRSPVVAALLEAAENNKQVAVLVELKARFDEESNIEWAKKLENAGVHVIYGLLGLKTHSKITLVVRREGDEIRRYAHLGTGNYNHVTAQLYEDLGLFTCDAAIGEDVTDLFNYLTGYSDKKDFKKLLVAPINLRAGITRLIQREIDNHKNNGSGHLIFKINSLVDSAMIQELYKASQAGVKVDLLVRGICCLRPGLKGVSENIHVTSIVGRFLEHSRMYYFHNNGKEEIYLGSADLMPRNINRRVEALFPIQDLSMIRYLRDEVLQTYLTDNVKARHMNSNGSYSRVKLSAKDTPINSQLWLLNRHQRAQDG